MSTTFTPAFDINPTGTTPALGRELRLRRLFAADGRTADRRARSGRAPRCGAPAGHHRYHLRRHRRR